MRGNKSMLINAVIIAVCVYCVAKYAKMHALEVKAQNKAIESAYNALLERKEFAQEAQAQDKEVYLQAVKLSK